jgi:putative oxidoreductase
MINRIPFVSLAHSLIVLRVATAIMFMAHAAVRAHSDAAIAGFGRFMASKGFPFPVGVVWGITAVELIGGALMIAGFYVRLVSAAFMAIAGMGIVLIHFQLGWFVGEHGTGGMEYSVLLMVALLVIAANDRAQKEAAQGKGA